MRHLTPDEIVSELFHRHALRTHRAPTRPERDLVRLVVEAVELAREQVPDCYVQSTVTPPTAPLRACMTCGGCGYVMGGLACPDCQGRD